MNTSIQEPYQIIGKYDRCMDEQKCLLQLRTHITKFKQFFFNARWVVISGEPQSGKSRYAAILSETFNWPLINPIWMEILFSEGVEIDLSDLADTESVIIDDADYVMNLMAVLTQQLQQINNRTVVVVPNKTSLAETLRFLRIREYLHIYFDGKQIEPCICTVRTGIN